MARPSTRRVTGTNSTKPRTSSPFGVVTRNHLGASAKTPTRGHMPAALCGRTLAWISCLISRYRAQCATPAAIPIESQGNTCGILLPIGTIAS